MGAPDINAFPGTSRIVADVAWTLKYEWIFYFSLPCLVMILKISRNFPSLFWFLAALTVAIGIKAIQIPIIGVNTKFFIYFLIGMFSAAVYENNKLRSILQKRIISWIVLFALLLLFTLFNTGYGNIEALLIASIFCPIAFGNSMFGILKLPALILLGEISYSLYLLHGILLYVCFTLGFPESLSSATTSLQLSIYMSVLGCVSVIFSWITFSIIEKPFVQYGRTISTQLNKLFLKNTEQ